MFKKITIVSIAISCMGAYGAMQRDRMRDIPRGLLPRIIGASVGCTDKVAMLLFGGQTRFVKPRQVEKPEVWLEQLSEILEGVSVDLLKIVMDYAALTYEGRHELLYNKERPNLAVLFDDCIVKPFFETGCEKIDAAAFEKAALAAIKSEGETYFSMVTLLYRIVRDMRNLGVSCEASPFEFTLGKKLKSGACLVCGETFTGKTASERCGSIYKISQKSLDAALRQDKSISVSELVTYTMTSPKSFMQSCTRCKKPVEVTSEEVFVALPSLLLLQFDRPSRSDVEVTVPTSVELFDKRSARYTLQGACFEYERRKHDTHDTVQLVQIKGLDNNWYLQDGGGLLRHEPIDRSGNLLSYCKSRSGKILPTAKFTERPQHYPKFLLYKKFDASASYFDALVSYALLGLWPLK